jgi:predicted alpha/beta-fold hydrolase
MEREEVQFKSHGDDCAAWLYPSPSAGPSPAIVMAHGLTGTRRDRLGPFAERFAQVGITGLVFDHRGFGDSEGQPDCLSLGGSSRTGPRRSPMSAASTASTQRASRRSVPRWAVATP